jgi:hypothetical protein
MFCAAVIAHLVVVVTYFTILHTDPTLLGHQPYKEPAFSQKYLWIQRECHSWESPPHSCHRLAIATQAINEALVYVNGQALKN